jgi:hypothetical protein
MDIEEIEMTLEKPRTLFMPVLGKFIGPTILPYVGGDSYIEIPEEAAVKVFADWGMGLATTLDLNTIAMDKSFCDTILSEQQKHPGYQKLTAA